MNKPTIVSDNRQPKSFLEVLQNKLIKRYSNSFKGDEPIVYEFTNDRALLHQYYLLREKMYRKVFNTEKFSGAEDVHDKLSYILIARKGNLCLGGCRLTVREADEQWALPLENDHFKLRDIFPDLPFNDVRHGEISRFAIMEDCKEAEVFHGLCKIMYEKVVSLQIDLLFAKSTYTLARNWRLIANSFGVKTTRICSEIDVPENPIHPEVKWYITLSKMSNVYAENRKQAVTPVIKELVEEQTPALNLVKQ